MQVRAHPAAAPHPHDGHHAPFLVLGLVVLLAAMVTGLVGSSALLGAVTRYPVPTPRLGEAAATPTPLSTAQRLRLFEQVWQLVDTQYVYTDFHGLDWPGIHEEYTPKIRDAASD